MSSKTRRDLHKIHDLKKNPVAQSLIANKTRYERQDGHWLEQIFQMRGGHIRDINQIDSRDVDIELGLGHYTKPWAFNFSVDAAIGRIIEGSKKVHIIDEYSFAFDLDEHIGTIKCGDRELEIVHEDDELPAYIEDFETHTFDSFVDLNDGHTLDEYQTGDLIYVGGTRNDNDDIVQHRSGVKRLQIVGKQRTPNYGENSIFPNGIANMNSVEWYVQGEQAKRVGILDGVWILPGDNLYDEPGSEVYGRSRYDKIELARFSGLVQRDGMAETLRGRFAAISHGK